MFFASRHQNSPHIFVMPNLSWQKRVEEKFLHPKSQFGLKEFFKQILTAQIEEYQK